MAQTSRLLAYNHPLVTIGPSSISPPTLPALSFSASASLTLPPFSMFLPPLPLQVSPEDLVMMADADMLIVDPNILLPLSHTNFKVQY